MTRFLILVPHQPLTKYVSPIWYPLVSDLASLGKQVKWKTSSTAHRLLRAACVCRTLTNRSFQLRASSWRFASTQIVLPKQTKARDIQRIRNWKYQYSVVSFFSQVKVTEESSPTGEIKFYEIFMCGFYLSIRILSIWTMVRFKLYSYEFSKFGISEFRLYLLIHNKNWVRNRKN